MHALLDDEGRGWRSLLDFLRHIDGQSSGRIFGDGLRHLETLALPPSTSVSFAVASFSEPETRVFDVPETVIDAETYSVALQILANFVGANAQLLDYENYIRITVRVSLREPSSTSADGAASDPAEAAPNEPSADELDADEPPPGKSPSYKISEDGSFTEEPTARGAVEVIDLVSDASDDGTDDDAIQYEEELGNGAGPPPAEEVSLLGAYTIRDDPTLWEEVCLFFDHPVDRTKYTDEVEIKGTNLPLRPQQAYDVYKTIDDYLKGDDKTTGNILGHEPGSGKTYIFLANVAVQRLVVLCILHVRTSPDLHADGRGRPCRFPHAFGILCLCRAGSLTSRLAPKVVKGPSLLFQNRSLHNKNFEAAKAYFQDTILIPKNDDGDLMPVPFIQPVDMTEDVGEEVLRHLQGRAIPCQVQMPASFTIGSGQLQRRAPMEGIVQSRDAPEVLKKLEKQQAGPAYRIETQGTLSSTRYLFVFPIEATRMAGSKLDDQVFKTNLEFTRTNKNQRDVKVLIPLERIVQSSLVGVDEAHMFRSTNTKTYELFDALRAYRSKADAPFFLFLTGTPFGSSVKSLLFMLSLCVPPGRLDEMTQALNQLSKNFNEVESERCRLSPEECKRQWHEKVIEPSRAIFSGILYRRATTDLFFGEPTAPCPEVAENVDLDCPPSEQQRKALSKFQTEFRRAVISAIQSGSGHSATRLRQLVDGQRETLVLDLATCFPGLMDVPRHLGSIEWSSRSLQHGYPASEKLRGEAARYAPPPYAPLSKLPGLRAHADTILAASPRLEKLYVICQQAFRDRDGEGSHPKNVFVVVKRPIHAMLVQIALEKRFSNDKAQTITSGLIHAGMSQLEREAVINEWLTFVPEEDNPETRVLVSTYDLCATGFDNIKVASYCVHFGVHPSSSIDEQASRRVKRQGQRFPVHIFHLHYKSEGIDALTQGIREKGDRLTAGDLQGLVEKSMLQEGGSQTGTGTGGGDGGGGGGAC